MDGAQAAARNGAIAEAVGLSAEEVGALFDDGSGSCAAANETNTAHRTLQLQELAEVLQRVQEGATGALCLCLPPEAQYAQSKPHRSRIASSINCQGRMDSWCPGILHCYRMSKG